MNVKIDIAMVDDWTGLYVNNRLVWSNHTLTPEILGPYIVGKTVTHFSEWCRPQWCAIAEDLDEWRNNFPDDLEIVALHFTEYPAEPRG